MSDSLIPWAPAGFSRLVAELADLAMDLQDRIEPAVKPDGSLVTPADTELEARLAAFLARAEPDSHFIGEETLAERGPEYLAAALAGRSWVVDPIDGTALFVLGIEGWGISIGLMEASRLAHGLVAFPKRLGGARAVEFVWSDGPAVRRAEAALTADGAATAAALAAAAADLVPRPPVPGYVGQLAVSQRFAKGGLYAGREQVITFASAVQSMRLAMGGVLSGYLAKLKLWDLAGSWPLAWRLGMRACTARGEPVDLALTDLAWRTDPAEPAFLALREHILIHWPERLGASAWADIKQPQA